MNSSINYTTNAIFLAMILFCLSAVCDSFKSSISSSASTTSRINRKMSLSMAKLEFDALLFDCDGVIAETERDAHRVTFNEAFKEKGLAVVWDVDLYGKLLKIGGGKERMSAHFDTIGWPTSVKEEDRKAFVQELHLLKTAKFQSAVESGVVPLRPGVMRLVDEAMANGIKVAVCSTSNEAAVTTIVKTLLGPDRLAKMQIFAGDVVAKKKPNPDVYILAAKTLGVDPSKCWVVEDSEIGLKAAKSANMRCIVTKSIYTRDEQFDNADVIVDDLDHGLDGLITTGYLSYKASARAYKPQKLVDNAVAFAGDDKMVKMMAKIAEGKSGSPFGF